MPGKRIYGNACRSDFFGRSAAAKMPLFRIFIKFRHLPDAVPDVLAE